ncbi:MAG: translocation/assembly module TamB domain-containing protein [Gemmatimonadaceae bacterium]
MSKRTIASISAGVIVALALIAATVLYTFTQTSWGRAKVGGYVIGALRGATHGYVSVDRIDGNLLNGATIVGLVITDSARAPFVKADTIRAQYTLSELIGKKLYLDSVRIVHPVIVLNRMPGGKWNYDRIYPRDSTQPPSPPGFLSWITLRNVTVVDGHVTSHSPWSPSASLSTKQRDSVIRVATSTIGRLNLKRVEGGFQKTSDFRDIYATFPLMRLEDPGDRRQIIDVSSLQMTAEPLKPPSVRVTDAKGRFTILGDSLYFANVTGLLPGSRLSSITGRYNFDSNDLRLRLRADTVATNDLLWIDPSIPQDGNGKLDFTLDWVGPTSDYRGINASLAVAGATMTGDIGVFVTDTISFHDTNVRLKHLDTRTIQQVFPTIVSPRQGYLSGRVAATGGFGGLTLDADVAFEDPISGTSKLTAVGTVGATGKVVTTRNLRLKFSPLQVALARAVDPTLPIGGTLTGSLLLDGTTATGVRATGDLVHDDTTGETRIVGSGVFADSRKVPLVNANVKLLPLSLATAGQFAPKAGLRGSLSGPVTITGPMSNLSIAADLTTPDGGSVTVHGTMDLSVKPQSYDLAVSALLFDASQISSQAPSTSLNANVSARGAGFDPATLTTVATAKVTTSVYDSVAVDSAIIKLAAANGMLALDTLAARVPNGFAAAAGTFGLVAGQSGTLRYNVKVDSLKALARILPPVDTGVVRPRPAILAQRVTRADSARARAARATQVERAVTGKAMPSFPVDTPSAIPRSQLSGSIAANGTATGNIHTFDMTGSATGTNLVAFGSSVGAVSANYTWTTALTPQSRVAAQASGVNVLAMGFALDTVSFTANYSHPNGDVTLKIFQDSKRAYNATAQFTLDKDRDDLRLDQLRMRFDTTVYASTGPSTIHFSPTGTAIDHFEIRSQSGSRVFVNGEIPEKGDVDLDVSITQFEARNITALLQSDIPAHGLFSVEARMHGTRANPTFAGAFGIERFFYNDRPTPEIHGRLNYANETLEGNVTAAVEGMEPAVTAKGTVPINLSLVAVSGARVPPDRAISATVDADSLPLNLIPQVTDAIADLNGRALAKFSIKGTVNNPDVEGNVTLWNGSGRVVPLGLVVSDGAANIRLVKDTVIVDSLVVRSNGLLRLSGGVGIKNLAKPSFNLRLNAVNARVIDNETGNLFVNATIGVNGPYDDLDVTGFVHVRRGVIYIPESTGKSLVGAGDPALYAVLDTTEVGMRDLFPTESPLLTNLRMNVGMMVDHDVFVRSQEANVEVYTDDPLQIGVNRAKRSLLVDGVLLSDRGEYRFQSRTFQIRQGVATFINSPKLNPTLQVTGEYDVQLPTREAFAIQIIISGTLDSPKITLTSDAQPPISQTDLLSYLAFGRSSSSLLQQGGTGLTTGGNVVGAGAAFAAKQIAAAAVGALTEEAAGQAAKSLGADVLNITPADVSLDAGSFLRATQIEFGKYLSTNTFLQLQVRPDPASLQRPGFQVTHRFNTKSGYRIDASFQPRYLLKQPTLSTDQVPQTTSAFGLFLVRQWRY